MPTDAEESASHNSPSIKFSSQLFKDAPLSSGQSDGSISRNPHSSQPNYIISHDRSLLLCLHNGFLQSNSTPEASRLKYASFSLIVHHDGERNDAPTLENVIPSEAAADSHSSELLMSPHGQGHLLLSYCHGV